MKTKNILIIVLFCLLILLAIPVASASYVTDHIGLYYNWSSDTGTTITDDSGNSNTGFANGTTLKTSFTGSYYRYFPDNLNYITTKSSASITYTTTMSAEVMVRTNKSKEFNTFLEKRLYSTNGYWFGTQRTGKLYFYYVNGGTITSFTGTTFIADDHDHVCAVTFNTSCVVFYIDGNISSVFTGSYSPIGSYTGNLTINENRPPHQFDGRIYYVRLYSDVLTPDEVQNNYVNEYWRLDPVVSNANLYAYYNFSTDVGTTIIDSSGNNRNASNSGTVLSSDTHGSYRAFDDVATNYLGLPSAMPTNLSVWNGVTYETVIKPDSVTGVHGLKGQWMDRNTFALNGSKVDWIVNTGSEYKATSTASLTAGKYYHLAVTYNNITKVGTIYINGYPNGTFTASAGAWDNTQVEWGIGRARTDISGSMLTKYFDGNMYFFRVYDRELTAAEIYTNYNASKWRVFIPPIPSFTVDDTTVKAGETVQFNDTSGGDPGVSWLWDFGDGETSTDRNATHAYDDVGVYSVMLTVTNDGGDSRPVEMTDLITVTEAPPVIDDFTGTPDTGTSPFSVTFTCSITSGTVTQYYWIFGDGYTGYGAYHQHTYYQKGVYNVTLIATGPGGSDTMTKTAYINCTKPAYEILKKVETGTPGYGMISEDDYNDLMNNTIGDNQSWEDLDLPGVMSAVMAPGPRNFGPFFWIIVFGAIGTFIYIKTDSVIIPGALFLIGSGLIGPMILPEFGNIIWGVVIVGFAGLGYILFKSR